MSGVHLGSLIARFVGVGLAHKSASPDVFCGSIHNLLVWMADNLDDDLSVAKLSRRVAMSQRNFSRQFLCQAGKSPGKHVIDLRLEAAQRNMANMNLSLTAWQG
jgi:transcriptional regulator GlxA family with amidase domain